MPRSPALRVILATLVFAAGCMLHPAGSVGVAQADTTDVVVIGCEFIAQAVDGNLANPLLDADVQAACGGDGTGSHAAGFGSPLPATGTRSIKTLASAIGDKDGALEASDFRTAALDEDWDQNQINTDCSDTILTNAQRGSSAFLTAFGFACTLDTFVFVTSEGAVTLDLPSGLSAIENGPADFTCTKDVGAGAAGTVVGTTISQLQNQQGQPFTITTFSPHGLVTGNVVTIANNFSPGVNGEWSVTVLNSSTFSLNGSVGDGSGGFGGGTITLDTGTSVDMRADNDCADGTNPALGSAGNGDGVVMFHVIDHDAQRGQVRTVHVSQSAVLQAVDVHVVGSANNVALTLAEPLVETSATAANLTACQAQIPWTAGVAPPTSTVAKAIVTDQDDTVLTRVPVTFSTVPVFTPTAAIVIRYE